MRRSATGSRARLALESVTEHLEPFGSSPGDGKSWQETLVEVEILLNYLKRQSSFSAATKVPSLSSARAGDESPSKGRGQRSSFCPSKMWDTGLCTPCSLRMQRDPRKSVEVKLSAHRAALHEAYHSWGPELFDPEHLPSLAKECPPAALLAAVPMVSRHICGPRGFEKVVMVDVEAIQHRCKGLAEACSARTLLERERRVEQLVKRLKVKHHKQMVAAVASDGAQILALQV